MKRMTTVKGLLFLNKRSTHGFLAKVSEDGKITPTILVVLFIFIGLSVSLVRSSGLMIITYHFGYLPVAGGLLLPYH